MTGSFIDHLPTPCGDIAITDAAGRRVPFSLRENPYCPVYSLFYGNTGEDASAGRQLPALCPHR